MSQFQQLRVVHPVAVNRTVVHTYNFRLQGRAGADVPEHHQLRQYRQRHRLAGAHRRPRNLQPHRHGLASEGAEWLEIGRGYQSDVPDEHGGRRGKNSTSEVYIRNMFEAWLGYMTNAQVAAHARHPNDHGEAPARRRCAAVATPGTPPRSRAAARAPESLDVYRCEQFLVHEARLLDEARFDEWLALFTADGWYWVPSEPEPGQPARHGLADL